jgi:hypothetical protein
MRWFTADLHIHSVLSPCGGLEMAPDDLIARLKELEINWFAITDHNSMANCPAYHAAAKTAGLEFSWGVDCRPLKRSICWSISTIVTRLSALINSSTRPCLRFPMIRTSLGIKLLLTKTATL